MGNQTRIMTEDEFNRLPREPEDPDDKDLRPSSRILGSIIVDGLCQLALTFWLEWILSSLFPNLHFNFWMFWFGMMVLYVGVYHYVGRVTGKMLVAHIRILLIATAYIWIFT
jgi:hypothetical protein